MELRALDGPPNDLADDPARKPIVRHNLHDAIVSRVRDMIIEGRLTPGARIHEGNLGQELGVSRTPLREALKYLASEGLLELSPGRGAVVRKFLAKDVQDSLVVLADLESLAGQLACKNASDDEIHQIRDMHDEMLRALRGAQPSRLFQTQSGHPLRDPARLRPTKRWRMCTAYCRRGCGASAISATKVRKNGPPLSRTMRK